MFVREHNDFFPEDDEHIALFLRRPLAILDAVVGVDVCLGPAA